MPEYSIPPRQGERGNALFLILIAVALFAALSYVVTQGGKGITTVTDKVDDQDQEQESMASYARLTQFPVAVQTVVNKMLLTGTNVADLDFSRTSKAKGAVFTRLRYQNPPLGIGAAQDWGFKTKPADGSGWFVAGIGTDGPDGKDVFAYLDGLSTDTCEQINKALGLPATPLTEVTTVVLKGKGGKADDVAGKNSWTFNAHNAATPPAPQAAACVRNGFLPNGEPAYTYYHVIIAK